MKYEIADAGDRTRIYLKMLNEETIELCATRGGITNEIAWLTPDGMIIRAMNVDPSLGFRLNSGGQVWEEGVDK